MQNKKNSNTAYDHVLAVEGGGTNCRVILGTKTGQEIGHVKIPKTANIAYGDGSEATANILEGLFKLTKKHKIDIQKTHIALCLAGVSHAENCARLVSAFNKNAVPKPVFQSDAVAGIIALQQSRDDACAIAIAGTGSIIMGLKDNTIYRSLGRGFPDGLFSGAIIGYDCLDLYLQAPELCTDKQLSTAFENFIETHKIRGNGGSVEKDSLSSVQANYYAQLFPAILKHYQSTKHKESPFKACLQTHLDGYANMINHFSAKSGISEFGFVGSVALSLRGEIEAKLNKGIHFTQHEPDALQGAFNFALRTNKDRDYLSLDTPSISLDTHYKPTF